VADNGIGIPKELHSRVFEPYFQLGSHKKINEGIGLGLSIVKKIVKDLDGDIELQSEPNRGTKITVSLLSLTEADGENFNDDWLPENLSLPIDVSASVKDEIADQTRPVVLVVEDNVRMLQYLTDTLRSKYNVYVSKNGAEALEKLRVVPQLDLIVSDVMMDEMDGFEFCKRLSVNDKYAHIPVIFLTAKTTQADKEMGLRLGAIDYIEKPFLATHLTSKIESVLENLNKQRSAVISKAYRSILSDSSLGQAPRTKPLGSVTEKAIKQYGLTSREVEIIALLCKGQPNKLIAQTLNISKKTVARHIYNIFDKVGVANRVELMNRLEEGDLS
jgi:DNA-binding NarL/FixJ family response regulator